jgi:putative transposase
MGTSQTCPSCQTHVPKPLSQREHNCPECGYSNHRDHAAAEMVLHRGLVLVDNRGMKTVCAGDLAGVGVTQSSQVPKARKGKTRKSKK